MLTLDPVCRAYQTLFKQRHPEAVRLVELHHTGQHDQFLREYFDHEFEKGLKTVQRFEGIMPGRHFGESLDFGCGAGGLTYRIAESSTNTVGIDLDPEKIAFGRNQAFHVGQTNVEFVCYDGGEIPLPSESFDTIFCIDVVEHLPQPERFAKEFKRLLRPGGMLYVSFGPPWAHAHGKHMWARLPGWWSHLLFPTSTCMRVGGLDPKLTWEELGLYRLTVNRFERMMRSSGLKMVHEKAIVGNSMFRPFARVPVLRELFVGEMEGVYQKV